MLREREKVSIVVHTGEKLVYVLLLRAAVLMKPVEHPTAIYSCYLVSWPVWLIANQMPRLCCQTLVQQMAKSLTMGPALFVVPLAALIVLLTRRCSSCQSASQQASQPCPFRLCLRRCVGRVGPISLAIPLDGIDYSDMH